MPGEVIPAIDLRGSIAATTCDDAEKEHEAFVCHRCVSMTDVHGTDRWVQCCSAEDQKTCMWYKCVRCYVNTGRVTHHAQGTTCRSSGGLYINCGLDSVSPWAWRHPFYKEITAMDYMSSEKRAHYRSVIAEQRKGLVKSITFYRPYPPYLLEHNDGPEGASSPSGGGRRGSCTPTVRDINCRSPLETLVAWMVERAHISGTMRWGDSDTTESVVASVYSYVRSLRVGSVAAVIDHFSSADRSAIPSRPGMFSLNIVRGQYGSANCYALTCACAIACAILELPGCRIGVTDVHVGLVDTGGMFLPDRGQGRHLSWAEREPEVVSLFQLVASLPIYLNKDHRRWLKDVGPLADLDPWTRYIAAGQTIGDDEHKQLRWSAVTQLKDNVAQIQPLVWLVMEGHEEAVTMLFTKLLTAVAREWRMEEGELADALRMVAVRVQERFILHASVDFWIPLGKLGIRRNSEPKANISKKRKREEESSASSGRGPYVTRNNRWCASQSEEYKEIPVVEEAVPPKTATALGTAMALLASDLILLRQRRRKAEAAGKSLRQTLTRRIVDRDTLQNIHRMSTGEQRRAQASIREWDESRKTGLNVMPSPEVCAQLVAELDIRGAGLINIQDNIAKWNLSIRECKGSIEATEAALVKNAQHGKEALRNSFRKAQPWVMTAAVDSAKLVLAERWVQAMLVMNSREGDVSYHIAELDGLVVVLQMSVVAWSQMMIARSFINAPCAFVLPRKLWNIVVLYLDDREPNVEPRVVAPEVVGKKAAEETEARWTDPFKEIRGCATICERCTFCDDDLKIKSMRSQETGTSDLDHEAPSSDDGTWGPILARSPVWYNYEILSRMRLLDEAKAFWSPERSKSGTRRESRLFPHTFLPRFFLEQYPGPWDALYVATLKEHRKRCRGCLLGEEYQRVWEKLNSHRAFQLSNNLSSGDFALRFNKAIEAKIKARHWETKESTEAMRYLLGAEKKLKRADPLKFGIKNHRFGSLNLDRLPFECVKSIFAFIFNTSVSVAAVRRVCSLFYFSIFLVDLPPHMPNGFLELRALFKLPPRKCEDMCSFDVNIFNLQHHRPPLYSWPRAWGLHHGGTGLRRPAKSAKADVPYFRNQFEVSHGPAQR